MVRGRTWLIAILLTALLGRLLAAWAVQQHVGGKLCLIDGDAVGYWGLAQTIASGQEFAWGDPPRRVHRMPGFPAVLALSLTIFGERTFPARCVLAIIGTAACYSVYLLGRRLFDERVALIACGLTAISPVMTGFSVLLLSETLFALTLTLSVWCAANWLAHRPELTPASESRRLWPFLTGLAIALATYVRPSWLLAGPALAGLAVLLRRPRGRACCESAVMLAGLFGALLPWAWRNHEVCGHWVFTTLWSGPSLYDGLNPEANGDSNMEFFERDNRMAAQTEWDVDQHYRQAAWQFARENPVRAVELSLIKLWRYWKPWPSAAQFGGIGPALLVAVFFVPMLLLAARGAWQCRGHPWSWLLTLGPVFYFAAIHSVFVGSLRYRLPAEYPLCVLAAVGCQECFNRWRGERPDPSVP
jgi:4-amino-4-deoxy-L-arabinose transferase-like glycosyltransferase